MPGRLGRVKILVTGATGFIGPLLLEALRERGHEAWGAARYVTGRVRTDGVVFADLRDPLQVRDAVHAVRPEVVLHLGAMSPVALSFDRPLEYAEANYLGTVSLAEACLRVEGFRAFVFASTSETYGAHGDSEGYKLTEDTELIGSSPYAVSKIAAEQYLRYMHLAYEFPAWVLRPFNTYGRQGTQHFVVENIVGQMVRGETVRLGSRAPIRDYLWAGDHVAGYLKVLERVQDGGGDPAPGVFWPINLCTGRGTTVAKLVELAAVAVGWDGEVLWDTVPRRPFDIPRLVGSPDRARETLGWKPTVQLEDGLKRVAEYWRGRT